MKKLFILLAMLWGLNSSAQILVPKKDYVPEVRKSRYSFAMSLIAGANSSPVTFGILRQAPDSTKTFNYLRKDSFMRQVTAAERSKANPDKINFLEEYEIDPAIFDVLWKLKYSEYPYDNSDEKGWGSSKGIPSKGQFEMLEEFGVGKVSDYFYGENLFKLLMKINDPIWVQTYKGKGD